MDCSGCGVENPTGARFCEGCGSALAAPCSGCGHRNRPAARFCTECGGALGVPARSVQQGAAVAVPAEAVPADPRFASPRRYTPPHLAEKILSSRSAVEGERKQVTALFCDLVDSTGLAERLGPEGMHDLLNRFFE